MTNKQELIPSNTNDVEHLTLALVQQEGVLNECEALLRQALDEDGVNTDFAQRLYDYWKKSEALADWRTRDMLIAARCSGETSEQLCSVVTYLNGCKYKCMEPAGHGQHAWAHTPKASEQQPLAPVCQWEPIEEGSRCFNTCKPGEEFNLHDGCDPYPFCHWCGRPIELITPSEPG